MNHPLSSSISDKQIIKEFECVGYDKDEYASEKCVCGKKELVWLYYMKNKKKVGIDHALSTFIVGSVCINTFYKSRSSPFGSIILKLGGI